MIGEISIHSKKSIITKNIRCSPNVFILISTVIMISLKKRISYNIRYVWMK